MPLQADHLLAFIDALADFSAGCVEMRVFQATIHNGMVKPAEQYSRTLSGWYDNSNTLKVDAQSLNNISGYVTVNPIVKDLLARADNKLRKAAKDESTKDVDVVSLRWAFLDIDPIRQSGISATQGEFDSALALQARILAERPEIKAASIWGCSGNGGFILVRLPDFPNDAHHRKLVERFHNTMRALFKEDKVEIDKRTFNPSRVMALPGTMKCKGDNRPDRPWRPVTFDSWKLGHTIRPEPLDLEAFLLRHEVIAEPAKPMVVASNRHPGAMSVIDRARAWVAKKESAIDKQDGSAKTFDVAMDLIQGFGLSIEEARPIMLEYSDRCLPPWSPGEIEHKLEDAEKKQDSQGRPRGWIRDQGAQANGNGHHVVLGNGLFARDPDEAERLKIVVRPSIHEVCDEAEAALSLDPNSYQRSNMIVTVLKDDAKPKCLEFEGVMPRIVPMESARVRELVGKNADWVVAKVGEDGEVQEKPVMPPDWVAPTLIARSHWRNLRPIQAVVESPLIRSDGSILDVPGYDGKTGILFEPNVNFDPIPKLPTGADAIAACDRILDLVSQFPFVSPVHKAAWLAALLTPFARFAIAGACPMFLFDANNSGSGKSKLVDVIASVTMGRDMPRTACPSEDDEMLKQITSIVIAAQRMVLIDNIPEHVPFGGASLDAALTATSWNQRILGASKMTGDLPLFTLWYATGNNVQIKGDGFRRIVYCRIESPVERAEEREGFKHNPLEDWVKENRPWLVRDCLTILRAFHLAGRPKIPCRPMDYPKWSDMVRSAVYWVTGYDCWANHDELRASDPFNGTNLAIVEGWREMAYQGEGMTAATMLKQVKDFPDRYARLHEALMEWSSNKDLPTPKQVGVRLKHIKGRVFNGYAMQAFPFKGTQIWSVRPVGAGGSEGSEGTVSGGYGDEREISPLIKDF